MSGVKIAIYTNNIRIYYSEKLLGGCSCSDKACPFPHANSDEIEDSCDELHQLVVNKEAKKWGQKYRNCDNGKGVPFV